MHLVSNRRLQHCVGDAAGGSAGNGHWRHPKRVKLQCLPDCKFQSFSSSYYIWTQVVGKRSGE